MTNHNTGKVPLTVYLPVRANREWVVIEQGTHETAKETVATITLAARPIGPATVTVKIQRTTAWAFAGNAVATREMERELHAACHAALALKPCPVMVVGECDCCPDAESRRQRHRRPCKLTEGHGKDGSAHA